MKWGAQSGALIEFVGAWGEQNTKRGGSWLFLPGLGVGGLFCLRTYSLAGVRNFSIFREQSPVMRLLSLKKKFFFKFFLFFWVFGGESGASGERTSWRNRTLSSSSATSYFMSHLLCLYLSMELTMSPDLPQVRLTWDNSYGRKQNILTPGSLKNLPVLVKSQMASSQSNMQRKIMELNITDKFCLTSSSHL